MVTFERKLPIGIQTFEKLRNEDYLYVDKTEQICNWPLTDTPITDDKIAQSKQYIYYDINNHSSANGSNMVVLKYFSARSGKTTTMFPSLIFSAVRKAAIMAAPLLIPAKMPSRTMI